MIINRELKVAIRSGIVKVAERIALDPPELVIVTEQFGNLLYGGVEKVLAQTGRALPDAVGCHLTGATTQRLEREIEARGGVNHFLADDDARAQLTAIILSEAETQGVVNDLREHTPQREPSKILLVTDLDMMGTVVVGTIVARQVFGESVEIGYQPVLAPEWAGNSWLGQIVERVFPKLTGLKIMAEMSDDDWEFHQSALEFCATLVSGRFATDAGWCAAVENRADIEDLVPFIESERGYNIPGFYQRFCDYFETNSEHLGQVYQATRQAITGLI